MGKLCTHKPVWKSLSPFSCPFLLSPNPSPISPCLSLTCPPAHSFTSFYKLYLMCNDQCFSLYMYVFFFFFLFSVCFEIWIKGNISIINNSIACTCRSDCIQHIPENVTRIVFLLDYPFKAASFTTYCR